MSDKTNAAERPAAGFRGPVIGTAVLIVVLALVVRGLVYVRLEYVLHADEALQGLMARHILSGEIQLFTYGQPFLGTLQAHWIALCFALFGATAGVLKWAAGVESLLLILANYLLAREICGGDRRAGFFAALLTAIGPLYLIEWSLRPRGGHLEVATLSALALWALLRSFRAAGTRDAWTAPPRAALGWLALCAFLLGLGLWVHLTMIYAIVACKIAWFIWGGRLRFSPRVWLVSAVGFLAGSLPFWLYNVKYTGRTFVHVWEGIRTSHGPALFDRVLNTLQLAVPILLGSRQTEAATSFGTGFVLVSLALYAVAVAAALAADKRPPSAEPNAESGRAGVRADGVGALVLFIATAFVVFLVGAFAGNKRALDPNVLLPLYGALLPLAAVGIVAAWRRGGMKRNGAVAILVALLVVHVSGYRRTERDVIQPFAQEYRVPEDLGNLRDFLEAQRIRHIFTNYYIGYRLAFETGEEVIPYTQGDPIAERHMPYAQEVLQTDQPVAFVVGTAMADWLEAALAAQDIRSSETRFQEFHIIYNLTGRYREYPPGAPLCVPAYIETGPYPTQCRPGEKFSVQVTVTNQGRIAWPPPPSRRTVRLSYHVADVETESQVAAGVPATQIPREKWHEYDGDRTQLRAELAPGSSVTLTMEVVAPTTPGRYWFVPDLVIEGLLWLSDLQPDLKARNAWREFVVGQ